MADFFNQVLEGNHPAACEEVLKSHDRKLRQAYALASEPQWGQAAEHLSKCLQRDACSDDAHDTLHICLRKVLP